MNLRLMLAEAAARYGEKTVIVLGDRRLSYAELDEASNKLANALVKIGVSKGDRVTMLLPNIPEFAIIYYGIIKIGAIAVPLDVRYKLDELASIFGNCQPKALISESSYLEPIAPALPRFKSIEHVIDLTANDEGQFLSYQEITTASSAQRVEVALEPDDIANIVYTSGPTSHPKGVMLSHQSIIMEAASGGVGFQQTDRDVVMLYALPLYHSFGLIIMLLTSIYEGSAVVIVPGLSIGRVMEAIEKERGTIFMGVPPAYVAAVNMAEKEGIKYDLSSLRLCATGGSALPIDIAQRFKEYYGLDIVQFWGLTEAVAHNTCQYPDNTKKLASVGKALSVWKVKIVDENDEELPPNQPGEVIISGPIMKGYYNDPQATAEVMKDGWLYTGDIGQIDEDGDLFIVGRKKEMILVSGQNVFPIDIEEVLYTHPKVAEAAVIGVPDPKRGETVRAVISLKEGKILSEQEIKSFCREHMADYKVPRQIIFMDSLPKTASGEIRREDLRNSSSALK